MSKQFFAIEFAYGRNVLNNGNRADRYHAFKTAAARDAWVAEGSDFDGAGSRAVVSAKRVPQRVRDWQEYTQH